MATKNNPGAYDCYANAAPDEPLFVLLGRDRHAPALVRIWARLRALDGEDADKVREAFACADAMDAHRKQLGRDPAPIMEALGTLICSELAQQLGADCVDNLGDGESVVLMSVATPAINLTQLVEALFGAAQPPRNKAADVMPPDDAGGAQRRCAP
jgi:hypothetical protein